MTAKYPAPRPGSRKRKIWDCFREKGRSEAFALAKRLRIKATSMSVWASTWARNGVKPKRPAKAKPSRLRVAA